MGEPGIIRAAYMISGAYGSAPIDKASLYNGSVIMTYAPMRIQQYRDMPICAYEHRMVALYDCMREAAYDEIVMP